MADDDYMSDEDKALFRAQMQSVKPLKNQKERDLFKADKPAARKKFHRTTNEPIIKDYALSDYIADEVQSDTLLSYAHSSIPSKRFRELRVGQIPWEARLDLHGMKADDARESLSRFIQEQTEKQKRCLLIIHGKGGHLGAAPVIKNLVNRWLPQIPEVLAFHSALAKDGGHGAVYVLLKRNREEF